LRFVSFLCLWVLVSFSGYGVILAPFLPFHLLVASHAAIGSGCFPVALCVAALGAAGVVCGGGRRHGGRLGLGCIVQRVRGLEVFVAFHVFSVLVGVFFFLAVPSYLRFFFCFIFEWLLTRRFVLVASPLLCALRRLARRAWCVAACGDTAGDLVLVASCSGCVA
jgi:hypothetical protein